MSFFEKEEWKIVADNEVKKYVNISNLVTVYLDDDTYKVPVVVPVQLFKFMKEVLKMLPKETGFLYLDRIQTRYNFGIQTGTQYSDLWVYSALPAWAKKGFAIEA